tara:strand:+ start:426 stop:731 length:306 start_codon:yes stop_codon:yes gene_type:complete
MSNFDKLLVNHDDEDTSNLIFVNENVAVSGCGLEFKTHAEIEEEARIAKEKAKRFDKRRYTTKLTSEQTFQFAHEMKEQLKNFYYLIYLNQDSLSLYEKRL